MKEQLIDVEEDVKNDDSSESCKSITHNYLFFLTMSRSKELSN